jgi:hypothetical protein
MNVVDDNMKMMKKLGEEDEEMEKKIECLWFTRR